MIVAQRTVTEDLRTIMAQQLALGKNTSFWNMTGHLAFSSKRENSTGDPIIPYSFLGQQIEEKFDTNYVAAPFLKQYADILPVEYSEWSKKNKAARTVTYIPWPEAVKIAIEKEKNGEYTSPLVFLSDGTPYTPKKAMRMRKQEQEQAMSTIDGAKCETAALIMTYMNCLNSRAFNVKARDNYQKAVDQAKTVKDGKRQQLQLRSILDQPQPFYATSKNSPRIFAIGENIAALERSVRHTLLSGWNESDLVSSQLAIAAKEWQVTEVQEFLKNGGNIWRYIATELSMELTPETKDILKTGLYAVLYGAGRERINRELAPLGKGAGKKFLSLPLIKAMWQAREVQLAKIKENNGAVDCFGNFIAINNDVYQRSVLAQINQAWELLLLEPVIKLALNNIGRNGFTITLWQHDGFSWIPNDDKNQKKWKKELTKAVRDQAVRLGFITSLETTIY